MIAGLLVSTLIAFGATSGKPSVSETADALRALRAAGVGGYMIYPRSGLGYEYMSDEWLDYVEGVVGAAENLGMEIWLYDEFNWPSGSCRGRVPKENPGWAYSEYEVERQEDGSFVWRVVRDPDFGANNYSREAMDRFRALTHEKYERRLKRHFGKTIRGIMTDEPAHYSLARRREVAARRKATGRQIDHFRWWKECEEDYRKASGGRDFRTDAEAWYRGAGDGFVWKIYTENLARRFIAAHFEPTRKWCERNGLLFTGHLIAEPNPPVSAENNGLPVEVLSTLSVPGMDEIYSHADERIEWLTFHLMEQAARKNGQGGLVELFAMGPCDMTWEHMLKMIRIAAAHGADRYLLSLHQLNALGYTDPTKWWAMFVSPTQPWFTLFPVFAAEAERMSSFARKTPRYDVAVRYPERAFGVAARCKSIGRKYAVTDLGALLRELETAGYAVRLIGEDEATGLPVVASLDEARRCAQPSGKPGCLTRRYEDGSCLEVPLAETNGNARVQTRPLETAWRLAADRPVLSRIRFTTNGVARIRLMGPERVRFAIRCVPGRSCTVRLDGSPLEVRKDGVGDLPFAYRGLYGETEALALGSGVREMRLTEGRDDCFYLPALWMIRDFSPDRMDDFAGRLTYSATVEVPAEAVELRLETGGAVSSVAVDDEDLGARGWSPFVWKVPPTLRGRTVDLRIDLWTSVRPAFGREDVPDAHPVGKLDESFPAARLHKAEWILEGGQEGRDDAK